MSQHTASAHPFLQLRTVQLLARGLFIGLLVVPVTMNLPLVIQVAHAAPLEDCDLNGFDDATGVAVPFPGYDETRGDTPAGPGTADWWIKQNAPTDTGGTGSTGTGSGTSGGTSGGTSSGDTGSSGGSGSSGTKGTAGKSSSSGGTGGSAAAAKTAAPAVVVAAPAVVAPAPTVVASSTVASAPISAASTACPLHKAASEASSTAPIAGTTGKGGPTAESTNLWEALTVGFTSENKELFAGLSLLAGLALLGGLGLGVSAMRGISSHTLEREREPELTDETTVVTA